MAKRKGLAVVAHFPNGFMLGPGKRVALHTGSGTRKAHHLYWGKANYVWNNGGDVARIRRQLSGAFVDGCMYTGVPNGVAHCN